MIHRPVTGILIPLNNDGKDYINVDDNVETEHSLTNDQIVQLVSGGKNDVESNEDVPDVDEEPLSPPLTVAKHTWLASFLFLLMRMKWQRMICIHQN